MRDRNVQGTVHVHHSPTPMPARTFEEEMDLFAAPGKAGVAHASDDRGKSGYVYLNSAGHKLPGFYDTPDAAAKAAKGLRKIMKR